MSDSDGLVTEARSSEKGLAELLAHVADKEWPSATAAGIALAHRCRAKGFDRVFFKTLTIRSNKEPFGGMTAFLRAMLQMGVQVDLDLKHFWKKQKIKLCNRHSFMAHFMELQAFGANISGMQYDVVRKVRRLGYESYKKKLEEEALRRKMIEKYQLVEEASVLSQEIDMLVDEHARKNPTAKFIDPSTLPSIPLSASETPATPKGPPAWRQDIASFVRFEGSRSSFRGVICRGADLVAKATSVDEHVRKGALHVLRSQSTLSQLMSPKPIAVARELARQAREEGVEEVYLKSLRMKWRGNRVLHEKVLLALIALHEEGVSVRFHIGEYLQLQGSTGTEAKSRFLE